MASDAATRFRQPVILLIGVGCALLNAVALVQALNLYHALAVGSPVAQQLALGHGRHLFALERYLHIAVEPVVQGLVAHGLHTSLGVVSGAGLRQFFVWLYLHAFPAWLFAALAWSYVYKPQRFAVLRDVTIISALLAVACYRLYPVAPPRFVLAGSPDLVQDWTYGSTSVDPHLMQVLGFNPYAAFPSVHVLWALIPAWCLATGSRSRGVWLCALCFPALMVLTVICTGNHYVLDCVGSVAILAGSLALVRGLHHVRHRLLRNLWRVRHEPPAALALCLTCAGILVTVGVSGGIRVLIAAAILLLVAFASGRSPYLWAGRRLVQRGRQAVTRCDYVAGLLFVAGATAAAQPPAHQVSWSIRVCALLWLLACMCALVRHVAMKAASSAGRSGRGTLRRYVPVRRQRAAVQDKRQRVA
jgi:PAP2 superfamily